MFELSDGIATGTGFASAVGQASIVWDAIAMACGRRP